MKGKVLITKLERMGSLSHIIWAFLAMLFLVYLLITFSDAIFPETKNNFINWGKVDAKSQIP